jgi:hypothetical protein
METWRIEIISKLLSDRPEALMTHYKSCVFHHLVQDLQVSFGIFAAENLAFFFNQISLEIDISPQNRWSDSDLMKNIMRVGTLNRVQKIEAQAGQLRRHFFILLLQKLMDRSVERAIELDRALYRNLGIVCFLFLWDEL